ncbi:uncharacterized protein LOC116901085 [Rattus rattus]|uniref:uncharacterized protein LOC116901085 n=1 Tax=Rattus rattus TaxID=10117 RepID=UPI0013F35C92|nr:uncharacterized protein LOC116901085 [Rattus rattus]
MKATTVRADTRPQSPACIHATHLKLLIRKAPTLDTSRTPHPPGSSPHTDRRPRTHTSHLRSPGAHQHTPLAHRTHLTRPASTLQTPHSPCIHLTHLADSGATPHTWHIPDSTSIPHTRHTPQTPLSPRTHPRSPRAHSRLRVRRARSQRSRSSCRRSRPRPPRRAAPAGRGGYAELLRPEIRRGLLQQQRPRPRTPRDPARAPEPSGARPIPVACAARCWRPQDPRLRPCLRPRLLLAAAFLSTHRSPPSSPTLFSIGNSQLSPGRRHRLRRGRRRRSEELRQPPLKPRRGGRRDL